MAHERRAVYTRNRHIVGSPGLDRHNLDGGDLICGLAGIVGATVHDRLGLALVELTRGLAHRGPDGEGFWYADGASGRLASANTAGGWRTSAAMGHRRLSIVDLAGGAQPMANEDGKVWVVFNGEIYNHLTLRRHLEYAGHVFRTDCDTEVLIHGWEEWGEGLFGRLNGIFAFAIADTRTREYVLVRDPIGVKPLYIGQRGGWTWWSSEIRAARSAGLVDDALSPDALKLFLTFRFVPAPLTIWKHVWKLPPASYVRIPEDGPASAPIFHRYTTAIRSSYEPSSEAEWRDAVVAELDDAIERQLMADVPVGSLLSGGVDSSLVTMLMAARVGAGVDTFGIGFASDGEGSEAAAARFAADQLGVHHHSLVVDDSDYVSQWPSSIGSFSEPIANSGGLLLQLVCGAAADTHKVVLTGQGADEPLGGYPRHVVERLRRLGSWLPGVAQFAVRPIWGSDGADRLTRALAAPTRLDRYIEIFSVLPTDMTDTLVVGGGAARDLARASVERWVRDEESGDTLNELLRVDARLSLADDLLIVADHAAMSRSVELRVPFLDLEMFDLVERMPSKYKVSVFGERKWLYRREAARRLPAALSRRLLGRRTRFGRKRGFATPLDRWFVDEGGPLADPEAWVRELQRVPQLAGPATEEYITGANARKRLTLYVLSMWVRSQRLAGDRVASLAEP